MDARRRTRQDKATLCGIKTTSLPRLTRSTLMESSRREFLAQGSLAVAAGAWAATSASSAHAAANDKVTLGWIGVGGQGKGLLKSFLNENDVNVAAICDVD